MKRLQLELLFVTSNPFKITEAEEILAPHGIRAKGLDIKIEELQTEDADRLVRDKVLKAFRLVGRPLFVEHTGLYLAHLNGLPGGLTQLFWDRLEADRFCELFGSTADTSVTARTVIGYVDGRMCRTFHGEAAGRVAESPRGPRDFQWDCCFIPDQEASTYAELGTERKNEISMRRRALESFASFLLKEARDG